MPELPEVETVKRGLEPVLTNASLTKITLNRPNLRIPFPKNMEERLTNKTCLQLRRRGKYILIDFDSNETLVIHLGMSGSFAINNAKDSPHNHVVFETNNNDIITYNDPRRFGFMFIVETGKENDHKSFKNMGPEPLGNEFSGQILLNRLKNKKSPIKTALLDQSVVAGIGNIYACEALYETNISPLLPSNKLTIGKANDLVIAIKDILNKAIDAGGSTLRDHKKTDGTMGYFQHSFKVYGKEGKKCPITGEIIKKITQSGRSTFYCPEKQA